MYPTFQQRRFFEKREYTLTPGGIDVTYASFNKQSKTHLNFEEIGFSQTVISSTNKYLIVGMLYSVFGHFVVLSNRQSAHNERFIQNLLFYIVLFGLCMAAFIITRRKIFILSNFDNKPGMGFLTDPEKDEKLAKFLRELKIKRDAFLLESYGQINKNLPYEQMFNDFMWLRNNDVITEEERKLKVEELDRSMQGTSKIVGFGQRN